MGYTDVHGRPEIEPGDWFGRSPTRMRRRTTGGPAGAAQQGRSGRDDFPRNDESAEAVTEPLVTGPLGLALAHQPASSPVQRR